MNEWGYTNDPVFLERANTWREAAIADGWCASPGNDRSEPIEQYAILSKDGYIAHVLARVLLNASYLYEVNVHVWAPDGCSVVPPNIYDWWRIRVASVSCNYCGEMFVKTERVGFAGRSCADCLAAQRKRLEYPGWTN